MVSDSWELLGDKLYGDTSNSNFGWSISSSSNGDTIAVSAPKENDGIVKVYKLNSFNNSMGTIWSNFNYKLYF